MAQRTSAIVLLFCTSFARADDDSNRVPAKDPELRLELLRRVKADQEARTALIAWLKEHGKGGMINPATLREKRKAEYEKLVGTVERIDRENTVRLGTLVEKHGWPTHTLVGKDGSNAAWLLVQHADANPKFQRKYPDLMTKLPRSEVSPIDRAYMTDRVLLAEGKKQIYGTQFTYSNGKWEPFPLKDATDVDKRRREVGLQPLAEYVKNLESQYGNPSKK